jgi:hypothetical protein
MGARNQNSIRKVTGRKQFGGETGADPKRKKEIPAHTSAAALAQGPQLARHHRASTHQTNPLHLPSAFQRAATAAIKNV